MENLYISVNALYLKILLSLCLSLFSIFKNIQTNLDAHERSVQGMQHNRRSAKFISILKNTSERACFLQTPEFYEKGASLQLFL